MTAYTHVSSDGTRLCVPTVDERAFQEDKSKGWRPAHNIDKRIQEEHLSSYLHIYDTSTGEHISSEKVSKAWITHVQFCPKNKDIILYNHEWPSSNPGERRLWIWDGIKHKKIRNISDEISRQDWVCHEMWSQDGESIIYHGQHKDGPHFIGKINFPENETIEIDMPENFYEYGHFTIGKTGMLVSDGYYRSPNLSKMKLSLLPRFLFKKLSGLIPQFFKSLFPSTLKTGIKDQVGLNSDYGEWISIQKIDWISKKIDWIPLCKHQSVDCRKKQDSHPHPVFNHNNDSVVYFTSNKGGLRNIYQVDVQA